MTESMLAEALEHRAINHPYLKALQNGEFNNTTEIYKDFAQQYGAYSNWFPRYLTAVISKLESAEHRDHLLENLSEESGHLHDEDIEAIKEIADAGESLAGRILLFDGLGANARRVALPRDPACVVCRHG